MSHAWALAFLALAVYAGVATAGWVVAHRAFHRALREWEKTLHEWHPPSACGHTTKAGGR